MLRLLLRQKNKSEYRVQSQIETVCYSCSCLLPTNISSLLSKHFINETLFFFKLLNELQRTLAKSLAEYTPPISLTGSLLS